MSVVDISALVQYNNWANRRLIDTATHLSADQLMANVSLSNGSAFETLRHMLDVEWSWRLACEGKPATQVLWEIEPLADLQAVTTYWRAEGERLLALVQILSEDAFEREVIPSWSTRSYQIRHILLHILHHATNHRSEVGWYFTRLGHSPGDLEFLDYMDSP
jgi:uncharacterized damage-inducible protein DinB